MANGNIDPAMRPAVVLKNSSINPQESYDRSMDRIKLKQQQEIRRRNEIAQGIEGLMVDVKAWEDTAGFNEIMKDHQKVIDTYLELSKAGLNLVAPKTEKEVTAYKAIQNAHNVIKQKVDVYDRNKKQFDMAMELIRQDLARDPSAQKIDHAKTEANLKNQLNTAGVLDREYNLANLIVYKPDIGNLDKYISDNEKFITIPMVDPVTGTPNPGQVRQQMADLKEIYAGLDNQYVEALKQEKARAEKVNPYYKTVPLEDYFVARYSPAARGRLSKVLKDVEDEDRSRKIDLLNTSAKVIPGELRTNDNIIGGRNYNDRYDFNFPTTKLFKVPTYGATAHTGQADPAKGEDGWTEIAGGDYAEAELLFYDRKTDKLIFRTGQAAQNPWIMNNTTFDVPRENIPDAEKLPIIVDGEEKVLGDILPKEDKSKPKVLPLPANFWSKPVYVSKKK